MSCADLYPSLTLSAEARRRGCCNGAKPDMAEYDFK